MSKKMMMSICLSALLTGIALNATDTLTVQPVTPAQVVTGKDPIRIELKLDNEADAARIDFVVPWTNPAVKMQINGAYQMVLKPGGGENTFQGELTIKDFYGDSYVLDSRRPIGPGGIAFQPVITRKGQEISLPLVKLDFTVATGNLVCPVNQPLLTDGKFGQAISFDGEKSIAVIPQFNFNPEKGTIELWVFQSMILPKEDTVVFFLQSAGGPAWSYHCLLLKANSRKLQYYTYNGAGSRIIMSKELTDENWVKATVTFDVGANKMEFFVNGISQGVEKYDAPIGYKTSRLEMGGRLHAGNKLVQLGQMLVDEVRISDIVRDGTDKQSAPFKTDNNTIMLLHFDSPKPFVDESGAQTK
ncbi:MAG: LamG-like jellyroll fold domain-containing protein [Lentisphaerota bacterium]